MERNSKKVKMAMKPQLLPFGFAGGALMASFACGSARNVHPAARDAAAETVLIGPTHSLCDGNAVMRLRVFVEAQPGREMRGSKVRVENGIKSFALDGMCSYWISGGWNSLDGSLSRDRGWRTGTLTVEFKNALDRVFGFDDLGPLADCVPEAGLFDASVRTVRSERSAARCGTKGTLFDAAWMAIEARGAELWASAKPMNGGIRLVAVEAPIDGPPLAIPYSWPSSQPMDTFMIDGQAASDNLSGMSKLVSEPEEARIFRALRDQYLSDRDATPGVYGNWDGLKVNDGQRAAWLYMRDALPYEDEQGLLPFSELP
jgi:hypothetical protein